MLQKILNYVLSGVSEITDVEPVCLPTADAVQFPYYDPWFGRQWFLQYAGSDLERELGPLAVSSDIDAVEAWEIEKGRKEVIVAVVDTKVDVGHAELRPNLWVNYNDWPDGVDNDNNGYVDDVYGYGVANQQDADGHGTHVAGIIAAKNNNGWPVCGIAGGDNNQNGVRLMACLSSGGPTAIKYAADNGAVICNNSWSVKVNKNNRKALQDAVNYFVTYAGMDENGNQTGPMRGGLVLASAGNEGQELEPHRTFAHGRVGTHIGNAAEAITVETYLNGINSASDINQRIEHSISRRESHTRASARAFNYYAFNLYVHKLSVITYLTAAENFTTGGPEI